MCVRLRYIAMRSSGRGFPSAVARARASCEVSNLEAISRLEIEDEEER